MRANYKEAKNALKEGQRVYWRGNDGKGRLEIFEMKPLGFGTNSIMCRIHGEGTGAWIIVHRYAIYDVEYPAN